MTDKTLLELLEPHRDSAWFPDNPVSEAEIAAVEEALGHRFPEDYRELLRAAGACSIHGTEARVVLIPPRHLVQFNPDREHAPELAQMLIFADDQGDYFYFYDPKDLLGRSDWAIFAVEMSAAKPAHAIFAARSLRHLIERILAGEAIIA